MLSKWQSMSPLADQKGEAPARSGLGSLWDFQHPDTLNLWRPVLPRVSVSCSLRQLWEGRNRTGRRERPSQLPTGTFAQTIVRGGFCLPGTADRGTLRLQREAPGLVPETQGPHRAAPPAQCHAPSSRWMLLPPQPPVGAGA